MSTADRHCCIGWCGFDKNSLVLTFLSCLLRAVNLPDKILLTISDQCLWKSATEVQLKVKDGLPWQGQLLGGWWHGDFLQLVRIQIQIQIQIQTQKGDSNPTQPNPSRCWSSAVAGAREDLEAFHLNLN